VVAVLGSACGGSPSSTAAFSPAPSSTQGLAHPPITGYIHTSGSSIYDSSDKKVRLIGIDTFSLSPGPATTACHGHTWSAIPASEITTEAADGFNEVRIAITWENLEPTAPSGDVHHWDGAYLTAMTSAVRAYNQAGIAVILDFHQVYWSPAFNATNSSITSECQGSGMPMWAYPNASGGLSVKQAACDFYKDQPEPGVAQKPVDGLIAAETFLAGYFAPANLASHGRVIGFDMLNEPPPVVGTTCAGQVGPDMLRIYGRIGRSILAVNSDAALIYEDYAFESYTLSGFLLSTALSLPNSIYSAHAYPATWNSRVPSNCPPGKAASGLPFYTAHVQRAASFNQPLWIGEFNAFATPSSCPDSNWQQDAKAELDFSTAHDVSWSFWSFRDLSSHLAVLPLLQAGGARAG